MMNIMVIQTINTSKRLNPSGIKNKGIDKRLMIIQINIEIRMENPRLSGLINSFEL